MPATPEATRELLEQIGPIRNTHYGIYHWNRCIMTNRPVLTKRKGGFYDFTSDLSSKDTAYTSESLEPHTDTTYFTEPIVSHHDRYTHHVLRDYNLTIFSQGSPSAPPSIPHRRRRRPVIPRRRLRQRPTAVEAGLQRIQNPQSFRRLRSREWQRRHQHTACQSVSGLGSSSRNRWPRSSALEYG